MEPTPANIMAIHKATGLPIHKAGAFIAGAPDVLCWKILLAQRRGRFLYDPIEDDAELAGKVRHARQHAEALVFGNRGVPVTETRRGQSHQVWREMARILKEEHGILWFSPVAMNPGVVFD